MVETAKCEVRDIALKCYLEECCPEEIVSSKYCAYLIFHKGPEDPVENEAEYNIDRNVEHEKS